MFYLPQAPPAGQRVMLRHRSLSNLFANMKMLMADVKGPVLCTANMMFDILLWKACSRWRWGILWSWRMKRRWCFPGGWRSLLAPPDKVYAADGLTAAAVPGNEAFRNAASRPEAGNFRRGTVDGNAGGAVLPDLPGKPAAEYVRPYGGGGMRHCGGGGAGKEITIGRPFPTAGYICWMRRNPVMPTAEGELYLAGEGISEGYIGREDLTEAAFTRIFISRSSGCTKQVTWAGCARTEGLFSLGRRDGQVKINGQRVELSEIANAMLESGAAARAAVIPVEKPDGASELIAFIRKRRMAAGMRNACAGGCAAACRIIWCLPLSAGWKAFPITDNGKTDLLLFKAGVGKGAFTEERTAAAEKLPSGRASVKFSETYPAGSSAEQAGENVGETCNRGENPANLVGYSGEKRYLCGKILFEQGGTSLGALSVLSRYFNEGMEMTMAQFYENPRRQPRRSCYPGAGCTGTTGSGRRNIPRRFLRHRRFCPGPPGREERRCFSPEPQAFSVRIC